MYIFDRKCTLHTRHKRIEVQNLLQSRMRRRASFSEKGSKRFSCLIQPPRKLSKTKDPSIRLLHACVVNVVRTENEAISQNLSISFAVFASLYLSQSSSRQNRHTRLIFCSPANQMKTRNIELFVYVISQPRLCCAYLSTC